MPPIWPMNRSSRSVDSRRILASKLNPPDPGHRCPARPSCSERNHTYPSGTGRYPSHFVGYHGWHRWSPSMPASTAICRSCAELCPASVAWLASMFSLKSSCQAMLAQETDNRLRVHVVLVVHRLHRFGLDQEGAFEADASGRSHGPCVRKRPMCSSSLLVLVLNRQA